jgi:hypothetical protein
MTFRPEGLIAKHTLQDISNLVRKTKRDENP